MSLTEKWWHDRSPLSAVVVGVVIRWFRCCGSTMGLPPRRVYYFGLGRKIVEGQAWLARGMALGAGYPMIVAFHTGDALLYDDR